MTRLEVDYPELELAAERLSRCARIAGQVHGDARRTAGAVADCGHAGLADASRDFLGRWAHGMGVLTEDAGALVRLLGEAATTYRRLDEGLAAERGPGR